MSMDKKVSEELTNVRTVEQIPKPTLFIPLECRSGGDSEPVAVQYSLGWTVMGPLSGTRVDDRCSINFVRLGNKEFYVD
ncbi:unnamed protein product, partial [Porites lobata]